MVLSDFVIGPLVALVILLIAYVLQPLVTTNLTKKYYFPALLVKMASAIFLGLLYQFYYSGGDTFTYFTHGASLIYEAFMDDPMVGLRMIFGPADYQNGVYEYASKIWTYRDSSSYMVVRIAGFFAIFTGGSYVGTALVFATISFSGMWAMYSAVMKLFPLKPWGIALAILFIPSTVFWGSGILKDTITLAMLGWATAALIQILYYRKHVIWWLLLIVALYITFLIKKYIVISFVPAALIWAFMIQVKKINNQMVQWLTTPIMFVLMILMAYQSIIWIGQNDRRYQLDRLAETAKITAYDVGRWTGKNAGSRYDLGDLDGTVVGMLSLAPAAVNVALFRPYLWEVNSPLMLLAALESLVLLILTVVVFLRSISHFKVLANSPVLVFALLFSLIFAFAVGISTYNFGTLFRYKVPLMPFYGILLAISWKEIKAFKPKKLFLQRI
jgi:hypothetical protein